MSEITFEGVLPALITPFTDEGTVDAAALRAVVERSIDAVVGGLVATGSTGEVTSLTRNERRFVLQQTRRTSCPS